MSIWVTGYGEGMALTSAKRRAWRIALGVGSGVVMAVIIWLDIATGLWQNLVIISGVVAGIVMFVFTVLVLDRVMARQSARRWEPVTRIAYSEFLHVLADEELSEVSHGSIVARTVTAPTAALDDPASAATQLQQLREQIVIERDRLTHVLSRWASFLAADDDHEVVLQHIASIAWQFDELRDVSLEAGQDWTDANRARVSGAVASINARIGALIDELKSLLGEQARPAN